VTNPDAQFGEAEARELLRRAREGDADAFCTVAQAHEQRLFQQAVALCRNPSTAEDLAAETLIEAWKSIARFDGSCRFSTWLYAILLHRYQKLTRKLRSRPVPLSALPAADADAGEHMLAGLTDGQPQPQETISQKERAVQLNAALEALPEKHRQVVLLRFCADGSLLEIAAALGISVGTVKSRLHHGLEKLRKMKVLADLSPQVATVSTPCGNRAG
jgi:RNA polymerase sigma-70 factor (ECF subfamily)